MDQPLAGFAVPVSVLCGALAQFADSHHVAVDLLGDRALLLRGGGDLGAHVADPGDLFGDIFQRPAGCRCLLHADFGFLPALLHRPDRLTGT